MLSCTRTSFTFLHLLMQVSDETETSTLALNFKSVSTARGYNTYTIQQCTHTHTLHNIYIDNMYILSGILSHFCIQRDSTSFISKYTDLMFNCFTRKLELATSISVIVQVAGCSPFVASVEAKSYSVYSRNTPTNGFSSNKSYLQNIIENTNSNNLYK